MLSQRAIDVLDKHLEIFNAKHVGQFEKDINEREVRRKVLYEPFHSAAGITGLSLDEFREKIFALWALRGWKNKDWFFENTMKVSSKNIEHVKSAVAELCFGKSPIEERVNTFWHSTDGMRFPFISEILYLATDSKYPIYNQKSKTVLEQLGESPKAKLPRGQKKNKGLIYKEFISIYSEVLSYLKSKDKRIDSFEKVDTLFWLVNYSGDNGPVFENYESDNEDSESRILVVKMGSKQRDFHKLRKFWGDRSVATFGFNDLEGFDPSKQGKYDYEYLKSVMKENGAPDGRIKKIASYVQLFFNATPIACFQSDPSESSK